MTYPFSALVGTSASSGLDDLQFALLLNAVNPAIGGVLVRGEKGTAKSTAVRGLAALLPDVEVVAGDPFSCDPESPNPDCPAGPHRLDDLTALLRPVALVELPVGASEDRLAGSLDLERALVEGTRAFEPGLLAQAHRGILYVDEVNLLGDHLVDLLLDAAAMGTNIVEREGVSVRHPARFQLVGTMNPEEGELRPQLLDRFGLTVEIAASRDVEIRAEVVRRRLDYEADPAAFAQRFTEADAAIAQTVLDARKLLPEVVLGETALQAVVAACAAFEVDGMRADIVTAKTATTIAAWEGRTSVTVDDVRRAALLALPHRRRRGPFDPPGIDEERLDDALDGLDDEPDPDPDPDDPGPRGGGPPPSGAPDDGAGGAGASRDAERREPHPPRQEEATNSSASEEVGASSDAERREAHPTPQDGDAGGVEQTFGVGATFDPVLLRLADAGAGAWGRRSPARSERGHHVGAERPEGRVRDLDVAATLRAAAPHQLARGRHTAALRLRRDDLRGKVREGREGNLVLFLVDASGSMAARQRMSAVKGAVLSLLLDAYQRRDRIGLITFRGEGAELMLPPTGSVELGARLLADLPTGGRTPLAAGLDRAAGVLAAEAVRDPRRRPLLVALTDGRATAARGAADPTRAALRSADGLRRRGIPGIVVDTEDGRVRLGLAGALGDAMGMPVVRLEQLAGGSLAGLVRGLTTTQRRRAA